MGVLHLGSIVHLVKGLKILYLANKLPLISFLGLHEPVCDRQGSIKCWLSRNSKRKKPSAFSWIGLFQKASVTGLNFVPQLIPA